MRAELRQLDSPDAPEGLESYYPGNPECFVLLVAAHIGPLGEEGEELFHFTVCTARWLVAHPHRKGLPPSTPLPSA
jgi:hypothetical protein